MYLREKRVIKNKLGPNSVPCGTSAADGSQAEVMVLPSLTHCL